VAKPLILYSTPLESDLSRQPPLKKEAQQKTPPVPIESGGAENPLFNTGANRQGFTL
jgi:hypothetical protein